MYPFERTIMWWTVKQLADATNKTPPEIRKLCQLGKIRAVRPIARDWLISEQVAQEFLVTCGVASAYVRLG